ncbi:metalloendopeptidase OMA1, mitochondrial isoform X2 [Sinocyclocheilus anshuiensis]|uniref:metalloendopeptidase OMA1, mitochondrial isoform X2 n=1 Tax=Sinocyclocheilus anshuiensis TaxID=1608454 RepID=UPI0007B836AC|nr:PREDICTED: metalloendopeptidase OMA1, mitochondrial-like isoform X2 [Sinocyclocheilus anshuiensis]
MEQICLRLVKLDMLSRIRSLNRVDSVVRWCGQRQRPSLFASARTDLRTNSSTSLKPRGSVTVSPSFLCLRSRLSICITAFRPPVHPFIIQSTREIHTSGRLRALPAPLIWMVLKPLQKLMAIILGRSIRKWWLALPPNRKQLFREWTWRRRWHFVGAGAGLLFFVCLFLFTHLDESPVTGRTRLLVFSRENFMELAQVTAEAYMEEFKDSLIARSDPRHQAVELVVRILAERNRDIAEISSVPWTVHVVDGPTINAFVLPNGKVFIFTGMLEAVADIHQLVFILGHEMAHALIGHAFLFDRPFSRKLEAEADQVGLQLAAKACADVRAGPVFWQQMEIYDQLRGEPTIPEWLSTHPSHQNRVRQLDRLVPEALELRARCDCPALPKADPRVIFHQAVKLVLDNDKKQEKIAQEEKTEKQRAGVMLPLPQSPPVPTPGSQPQLG